MSFLAPLYALAGLAIVAPIIAHLVRRRPKDKIEFSSSLFLENETPRLTKSSQIDQWWLLAIRMLLVIIVAAAFARPYWNSQTAADTTRHGMRRLIMVDISASMQRSGLMESAQSKSLEWIESTQPEDLVAVYAFHRELLPLFPIESSQDAPIDSRRDLAKQSLLNLRATWYHTDFGAAVRSAVEQLSREDNGSSETEPTIPSHLELVIVSDFQQSGQYDELASIEWPTGLVVRQIPVGSKDDFIDNAFARVLNSNSSDPNAEESTEQSNSTNTEPNTSVQASIRVSNSPQSRVESFKIEWVDKGGNAVDSSMKEILIPPGQTRNVNMSAMPSNAHALRLSGDRVEFDNTFYCSSLVKQSYNILCLTNRDSINEQSAEFFLQQLPLGGDTYDLELRITSLREQWNISPQNDYCCFLIGLPEGDSIARLKSYMQSGGSVFWLLDAPVSDSEEAWQTAIRNLTDREIDNVSEGDVTDFRLLQDIQFSDYLFSDLSDAKFSDFTKVRFWRQRDLALSAVNSLQVLASFDHGKPALIRKSMGSGEVMIMAAGWQPNESQLALSSKFLPLLLRYIQAKLPKQNRMENLSIGSQIEIAGSSTLTLPDGTQIIAEPDQPRFVEASMPGNYILASSTGQPQTISANIDSRESQLASIDPTQLLQWGVPLEERRSIAPTEGMLRQMRSVELEAKQGSWRWLLAIVLICAAIESALAWLRSYRKPIIA